MNSWLLKLTVIISVTLLTSCGGDSTPEPASSVDTTPPVITLNGDANVSLPFAAAYREEGASAVDDVDGAITVSISGAVDTSISEVYTVTYSAEDSAGNRSTLTRTIEVLVKRVELVVSTVGVANYTLASGDTIDCSTRAGECRITFDTGTVATVTATAGADQRFVRWQNCDTSVDNKCTITLNDDRTVLSTVVSTEPLLFQPNVVQLSADQISSLVNYESAQDKLEFEASVDMTGIVVGNILLAASSSPDAVAFGRRVLSIESSPAGTLIVRTETPALPEIIRSGTIVATFGIPDAKVINSHIKASSPTQSDTYNAINLNDGRDDTKNIQISLTGDTELILLDDGNARIAVSGELSLDPKFELIYSLKDDGGFLPKVTEWRLFADTDFRAFVGTSISGEVIQGLNQKKVFPLTPEIPFPAISPVPVIFSVQPAIELGIELDVSIEPGLELDVTRIITGAQWTPDVGLRPLFSTNEPEFNFVGIDSISADLSFSIAPGIQANAEILGLAGPFIRSSVVGKATVAFQPFADCEVILSRYAAVRWAAGGRLDLLFYESDFEIVESEIALNFGLPDIPLACSNPTSGSGDTEPPNTVSGIVVFAPDVPGRLNVSWQEVTDDTGVAFYKVWRFRPDEESPTPVLVIETATTSMNDISLLGTTEYCYFVTAEDVLGNASDVLSNDEFVCATTASEEDSLELNAPTLMPAVALDGASIELVWSFVNNSGLANDFVVFDLTDTNVPKVLLTTSEITATISGLIIEQNYCFAVAIRDNRSRISSLSNVECATVIDAPTAPTINDIVVQDPNSLLISWSPSANGFQPYTYSVFDVTNTQLETLLGDTEDTSFFVSNLEQDTEYCYQVVASDSRGVSSSRSDILCASTSSIADATEGWLVFESGSPEVPNDGLTVSGEPCPSTSCGYREFTPTERIRLAPGNSPITISTYPARFGFFLRFRLAGYPEYCSSTYIDDFGNSDTPPYDGVPGRYLVIDEASFLDAVNVARNRYPECTSAQISSGYISRIDIQTGGIDLDGAYLAYGENVFPDDNLPPIAQEPGWVSFYEGSAGVPDDGVVVLGQAPCQGCDLQHTIVEELTLGSANGLTLNVYGTEGEALDEAIIRYAGYPEECTYSIPLYGQLPSAPPIKGIDGKYFSLSRATMGTFAQVVSLSNASTCSGISADDTYFSAFQLSGNLDLVDGAFIGVGTNIFPDG